MPDTWTLQAARACTGAGNTPAAVYATATTRKGNIQKSSLEASDCLFLPFQGLELPCFVCPADDDQEENGLIRSLQLAGRALAELQQPKFPWPQETVLALSLNKVYLANHKAALETARGQLVNQLYVQGDIALAQWCAQATLAEVNRPEDWRQLEHTDSVLWLSADSLLNTATVKRLNTRIATQYFDDGLVLGEAATALWLTRAPEAGRPTLDVHGETLAELDRRQAPLDSVQPYLEGLVAHLDGGTDHQAAWRQWLGQYDENSPYYWEQHEQITLGFGYVGTAGPGLCVVCALGRLQMPCPPIDRQWLVHQSLEPGYSLMTLDPNREEHSTAQDSTDTGGQHG